MTEKLFPRTLKKIMKRTEGIAFMDVCKRFNSNNDSFQIKKSCGVFDSKSEISHCQLHSDAPVE